MTSNKESGASELRVFASQVSHASDNVSSWRCPRRRGKSDDARRTCGARAAPAGVLRRGPRRALYHLSSGCADTASAQLHSV